MKHSFFCVDGHTCGNPVRLVVGGKPELCGATMMEKRLDFLDRFDWIRKGLMFEPRGHDLMSGSFIYPPSDPKYDAGILFIETSGCLPMCGHGMIGTVTMGIEEGLIIPNISGKLKLETPAGDIDIHYQESRGKVLSVRLYNIPSFLYKEDLQVNCPELGILTVDVAYGGNFYAIIDIQKNFKGIDSYTAADFIRWSPAIRLALNRENMFHHPESSHINGLTHILWAGKPLRSTSTARNAVFYGDKAIDRSPCGTGTSARLAQWHAKGKIKEGIDFIHESIIGSIFKGKVEALTNCGEFPAIIPSIEGWAKKTAYNTIFIDSDDDPYAHGFQVI